MGTRKSARLAAVCIGAATFVAAVPVLCAELQQVAAKKPQTWKMPLKQQHSRQFRVTTM